MSEAKSIIENLNSYSEIDSDVFVDCVDDIEWENKVDQYQDVVGNVVKTLEGITAPVSLARRMAGVTDIESALRYHAEMAIESALKGSKEDQLLLLGKLGVSKESAWNSICFEGLNSGCEIRFKHDGKQQFGVVTNVSIETSTIMVQSEGTGSLLPFSITADCIESILIG
jgi:hypothetical protein